jgi:Putative DNA-binding domain
MANLFWQAPLSEWDGGRIREFLDEVVREGDHLDYKEARPFRDSGKWRVSDDLLETIAALANTTDGLILVGVKADEAGYPVMVTGLPHANANPEKAVRDRCAADIEPAVQIDTTVVTVPEGDEHADRRIMLVRVRRGANPPYVLRDKGVYVRNDEHDRPARRADLDALYTRRVEQLGELQSPWTRVLNDVYFTANQTLETPWPIMLVGVTAAFPSPPIDLGYEQDSRFRDLCRTMLGYDSEPVLAPDSVGMRPNDDWDPKYQFSLAEAFADGSVGAKRLFVGADESEGGIRNVGVVALWRELRQMLSSAAAWPREVCGASGALLYVLALGNVTGSRLVLPDRESLEVLTAIDRGIPPHLNTRPMWVTRGEWEAQTSVDDIIEREFSRLSRVLQCSWWDRLGPTVRRWSAG